MTGVVAGVGAALFRSLIAFFHNLLFLGRLDPHYDALAHTDASPWGAGIIAVPVIGAVAVAFLVKTFAPEAKGHGVPEVMHAIYYERGVIRPQVALIKSLASSISIGSGGAIGREGPIIQIGAAFGSMVGRVVRVPEWEQLALIACGAAGGIAATFNTPIGGLLFAVELMLVEVSARTLVPVMIATGTATFLGRLFFGNAPSFTIPPLDLAEVSMAPASTWVAYVVLGLSMGVIATLFTRSIYAFEDLFDRIPGNYYTRHVLGMALVGVIMYALMARYGHYYVEGVGYAGIQDILDGAAPAASVLLLLVGLKLLATSLTLGSGASGGVFSPALFLGAGFGAAFAAAFGSVFPGVQVDVTSAAVIGMACMIGASTGAATTAVVMIFEMTRDYNVIIPLILAVPLAFTVRRLLMSDTIYTLKLSRRGQTIPASIQSNLYMMKSALELIETPFAELPASADLERARELCRDPARVPHVVLVADGGALAGVIPASVLVEACRQRARTTPLSTLADRGFIVAENESSVLEVMAQLRSEASDNVVIVADSGSDAAHEVLGVITAEDLLRSTNLPSALLMTRRTQREPAT
ncbi:MAG: chloride channel protein [Myxococcales bacterium]|nr:chloride channel protein [Myxococcales bacterium]